MLIRSPKGWELPEHQATPESVFLNRRNLIAAAAGSIAGGLMTREALAQRASDKPDPTLDLYPAKQNGGFTLDRPITREEVSSEYNNFYEFGGTKRIAHLAKALDTRPWTIKIDGMVEKEMVVDIDTLIRQMQVEERLYRFRCVEAWAMAVPWTGFPLSKLVALAKPTSGAKYLRFETFNNPSVAPGQKQSWYPWPYVEGVTMAEAANDLALVATGIYGKPLGKQFGAPIRLVLPWKYGFKSIKSIVRVTFTDQKPKTFWEGLQASEYGFWANVNPEVSHPRWSQASEVMIDTQERRPTQLFNGYGAFVADVYKGLEKERLWA